MDFVDVVDVVEVVSAVLRQLNAKPYVESCFIRKVVMNVDDIMNKVRGQNENLDTRGELMESLKIILSFVYNMDDFAQTFTLSRWRHLRRMGFGRRSISILLQMLKLKAKVDFRSFSEKIKLPDDKSVVNTDVVGLEAEKEKMVSWLIDMPNSKLEFLVISGQTGSGKTTLATEIYNSEKIKENFRARAWVSASEDPLSNLRIILQKINGDSSGDSRVDTESTVTELEKKVYEILQKERLLVVVDNVQSPFLFKTISDITNSQPVGGSRVIMTMRSAENKDVEQSSVDFASKCPSFGDSSYFCELKRLENGDAQELLMKKVPNNVDLDDEKKKKILEICQGIPSAIVVFGRFLPAKNFYEKWLEVYPKHENYANGVSVSKILAFMNSDLTFGLRPCLFYFVLFRRELQIPVRRLLLLWIAEGLIVTQNLNPEETAERILTYFTIKGIIEIVKLRKNGDPKICRMPGIVYDICLSKAEDIFGLLHIHPTTQHPESSKDHASPSSKFGVRIRRVAEHGGIKNYSGKDLKENYKHLRSYLSFNIRNGDTPAVEVGNFFKDAIGHRLFGLLRVLDLEKVYKPKLPENLGKLYHLRYLGLRWTFLDALPHSVGELSYLETLDVKHTYISSPPNSIWKMKYLRHLWLNEIRLDVKKHSISDIKLQTLWGLVVDNETPVKNGLGKLTALKKLGLTFHLDFVDKLNNWIANLKELQSLRLRSKDKYGRPSTLETLQPLSGRENLTNLYLLGKLTELNSHVRDYFPKSLAVLTLSVSKLKEDPTPILARLPNLSVLGLLADSYTGTTMSCPPTGFPKLRILKLWMLKELENWIVAGDAMQELCELEIRCCHKLKNLPESVIILGKIDKIILGNMQKEFVDKVRDKIPKEKLDTSSPLQVRCDHSCHNADVKEEPLQGRALRTPPSRRNPGLGSFLTQNRV